MADLSKKDAASTQKLIGADPNTGVETFYVNVSNEGEIKTANFANVDFQDANKTVTGTQQLAAVGGSNLANRKSLVIFNREGDEIYYGTSGVDDTNGIEIAETELITLLVGENIDIYIATKSGGTATVTIQEFS